MIQHIHVFKTVTKTLNRSIRQELFPKISLFVSFVKFVEKHVSYSSVLIEIEGPGRILNFNEWN